MADREVPDAEARRWRLHPARRRTLLLSVWLLLVSAFAYGAHLDTLGPIGEHVSLPWWALAVAFAFTETLVFHIEVDREAHTFTLSEIPIVVALFFASPEAMLLGRLVGEAFTLIVRNRQTASKVIFNLSMFTAECVAAIVVFRQLVDGRDLTDPVSWAAALAAATAADLLSIGCVALAIRWHGGTPERGKLLATGGVTALANTSLALTGAVLLSTNIAAIGLLSVIAVIAAASYRGYTSLSQRYASLEQLYEFTTVVGGTRSAESVVEALLDQAREVLRADIAEITLFPAEEGGACMRLTARTGQRLQSDAVTQAFDPADRLWRRVVGDRRPVLLPRDAKEIELRRAAASLGVKDCILVPLVGSTGVIGTLKVADRRSEISTFDTDDTRLFETLANHAAVALENGRLIDRLGHEASEREYQALHDDLTGLPNRKLFYQRLHEHVSDGGAGAAAVMLMDLDRFKEVNDTLGHHAGDRLLQEVARRLLESVPLDAMAARLGGDEFAILLPGVRLETDAVAHAARIQDHLNDAVDLDGVLIEPKGSIGIAVAPRDGDEVSKLLKCADVAMYAAKRSGSGVEVYDAGHDDHSPRHLALSNQLRAAIEQGDVFVHYQPKAQLADGHIVGVEALARWQHPEHGFVPPDEFVSIAERTGLIALLTDAVLDASVRQCRTWADAGLDVGVAVNLAVRSLLDPEFPARVQAVLVRHGLPPARLTLEITETSVMANPDRAVATLDELAALGVQLSIDDFGTGYSSLSYLQRLPVHEVKIDKGFVMGMVSSASDAAIVASIVSLSRTFGLRVVAEGVEDGEAWEALREVGCHVAQGYYLSRPVDAASLTRWMTERPPAAGVAALAGGPQQL